MQHAWRPYVHARQPPLKTGGRAASGDVDCCSRGRNTSPRYTATHRCDEGRSSPTPYTSQPVTCHRSAPMAGSTNAAVSMPGSSIPPAATQPGAVQRTRAPLQGASVEPAPIAAPSNSGVSWGLRDPTNHQSPPPHSLHQLLQMPHQHLELLLVNDPSQNRPPCCKHDASLQRLWHTALLCLLCVRTANQISSTLYLASSPAAGASSWTFRAAEAAATAKAAALFAKPRQ
jgi:hypothetical protein